MTGLVIKSTGSNYTVKVNDAIYNCKLQGKIRLEGRKTTNPIAVGDFVEIILDKENDASIIKILPRKNYIIRKSLNLSKQAHIIASNLDQAVLIATLVEPRTSLGFIDRFLITAEAYNIPAKLIFNKADVLTPELLAIQKDIIKIYTDVGYECFEVSTFNKQHIKDLEIIFKDKTTLIAGHSGVGKSTFINTLQPNLNLKTGQISAAHSKGMHTTTFAEIHALSFGGNIIDSPGIKELGLVEMKKEEVGHYFPEIRSRMNACKFNNCIHVNEPKCAIIDAVENNLINEERYNSYLKILNGEEMDWNEWEIK
jgi:ribosome biogenesis GTPase / thiamine phosphate phosphatase